MNVVVMAAVGSPSVEQPQPPPSSSSLRGTHTRRVSQPLLQDALHSPMMCVVIGGGVPASTPPHKRPPQQCCRVQRSRSRQARPSSQSASVVQLLAAQVSGPWQNAGTEPVGHISGSMTASADTSLDIVRNTTATNVMRRATVIAATYHKVARLVEASSRARSGLVDGKPERQSWFTVPDLEEHGTEKEVRRNLA